MADDPATKKPTAVPAVRALIDEPELDDGALEGIVGGGMVAGVQGDAGDSWSQTVYDHGLPVPARGSPPVGGPKPDADSEAQAPGASEVKRALLPGPATQASITAKIDDRSNPSPNLRSLFDLPDLPPDGK